MNSSHMKGRTTDLSSVATFKDYMYTENPGQTQESTQSVLQTMTPLVNKADLPAVGVETPACLCSVRATIQRARSTLGKRNKKKALLNMTPDPVKSIVHMTAQKVPFL